ncbi:OLC1v1037565C1 [Oldenlandia corymbosa var. corymbosa]|uniref:OLC1v1037565C1 n=1 Tax=Oldenlandia corymbosa var. corymbosa TaxID=529605 RepID=A0AAV1CZV3_OLDCO|nr:OLC1v1037565C1 [Oldenlandia corymbosa var. corymbosa]
MSPRRTRNMPSETSATILPKELMLEILTRLSGKKLGQCKCVCKSWQSLIGGLAWKDLFRSRPPELILYRADDPFKARDSLCLSLRCFSSTLIGPSKEESSSAATEEEEFSFLSHVKSKFFCQYFTQLVNGLICLPENGCRFYIYNVFTGHRMSLPRPMYYSWNPDSSFHLGYDPLTRMYKLLRLISARREHPMRVEIMTLMPSDSSASKWRELDNDVSGLTDFQIDSQGVISLLTADGFLWFLSVEGSLLLLSFHLNKEKFELIKLPGNLKNEMAGTDSFCFIQSMGRPAIWVMPSKSDYPSCLVLFVFENYEGNIWNKYSIHFPEELGDVNTFIVDAGNLPTGEILFMNVEGNEDQDSLVSAVYSYNHHTSKFDRFQVGRIVDKPVTLLRGSQKHIRAENIGDKVFCLHDCNYLYLSLNRVLNGRGD